MDAKLQEPLETVERIGPAPRIAVARAGRGVPVVFLHGIGGNRRNWSGELRRFGRKRMALAWDARGYGESDDYDGPLDFADFARDLARVLDAVGAPAAHLVGLSMGGLVAQSFYAALPRRVLSLTLVACRPGSAPIFGDEARGDFLELRLKPLLEGKTPADIAPSIVASLLGPKAGDAVRARIEDSIGRLHRESYIKSLRARVEIAPFLDLATIAVPTLVVAGGADRLAPPAQMKAIADAIPGARYVLVPGSGHLINLEAPAAFGDALEGFLDEVDRRQVGR
jgi:3-oxoadipate enol-lactonase